MEIGIATWEKLIPVRKTEKSSNAIFVGQWTKSCPDSYKNQMKIKEETNIIQIAECMDTLIGETLSVTVLDSGFTNTVFTKTWLNCYL